MEWSSGQILALIGGGVYLYFPAVFSITRIVLQKEGKKFETPASFEALQQPDQTSASGLFRSAGC